MVIIIFFYERQSSGYSWLASLPWWSLLYFRYSHSLLYIGFQSCQYVRVGSKMFSPIYHSLKFRSCKFPFKFFLPISFCDTWIRNSIRNIGENEIQLRNHVTNCNMSTPTLLNLIYFLYFTSQRFGRSSAMNKSK